ncbi:MAG: hypothetical protein KY446_08530 [Proteobacteria bacterium]|nr:hypothetical protein [Pseudomonadota bacterium]MBW3617784.1 hypothetical protein [Pseudomonadota bacterium]
MPKEPEADGYARPGDSAAQALTPSAVQGEWDGYSQPLTPVTIYTPAETKTETKALPSKNNPAEWMFDRLIRIISDFEKSLSDQEEIGGRLTGAPGEGTFHIDDIGFWGPDLIMFYGKNKEGRPIRLIQHYNQLSVLLTSVPKEKPQEKPRRIGFAIQRRVEGEERVAAEEAAEEAAVAAVSSPA